MNVEPWIAAQGLMGKDVHGNKVNLFFQGPSDFTGCGPASEFQGVSQVAPAFSWLDLHLWTPSQQQIAHQRFVSAFCEAKCRAMPLEIAPEVGELQATALR